MPLTWDLKLWINEALTKCLNHGYSPQTSRLYGLDGVPILKNTNREKKEKTMSYSQTLELDNMILKLL